jgi:hypothetical protein
MVGRFACVVALAAGGALGFLWLTVPQGGPPDRPAHIVYEQSAPPGQPVTATNLKGDFEGAPPSPATPPVDPLPWPAAGTGDPGRDLTTGASAVIAAMATPGLAPAVPRAKETQAVETGPSETKTALPASTSSAGPMPDRDGIATLVARGRNYLAAGDVAAARPVLRRAAILGDPQAALALGEAYDPTVLKQLGVTAFSGDPVQAREWYRRAAELGSAAALKPVEPLARLGR